MPQSTVTPPPKVFTAEQANAMLPLVRAIVQDWSRLSIDVIERRERLSSLQTQSHGQMGDMYRQELELIQSDLALDTERLKEYVIELRELGLEPRHGAEGIVDFPSLYNDRIVNLCWKLGERTVGHWHEVDENFDGRRPLTNMHLRSVATNTN
jgi:hypothetical protein